MTSSGENTDDKVVVDIAELGASEQRRASWPAKLAKADDRCGDVAPGLGRGTRDHPAQARASIEDAASRPDTGEGSATPRYDLRPPALRIPGTRVGSIDSGPLRSEDRNVPAGRIPLVGTRSGLIDSGPLRSEDRHVPAARVPVVGTRDLARERDPVAVLRMWPASAGPGSAAPAVRRKVDDKVVLAHLALDLYRELGQVEAGHGGHAASAAAAVCADPACDARISALRGGLVEACLLIQRLVMTSPVTGPVADQVRGLLALIDR
jgi:hypothetical protein